ncbi:MAG: hypothetical protein IKL70_06080 [Oscillospiraceae bacterium]|nr:hypothetical protein [Oscillospiraceae bacterium]MBQ5315403.1 hypothetical protein [Oscillospiraceae bacterium]MBQ7959506.1 hypothetical protein [Oscillospiraceae bacterium]MBR6695964.1 hypothetical protein [Oscillospiraceae bacterium]
MKINWKQKLTSRKFWAAVVSFVTTILIVLNYSEMEVEQVAGLITATASLIAYIIGEGMVDAKRVEVEKEDERGE